jgi:hypothetical protein
MRALDSDVPTVADRVDAVRAALIDIDGLSRLLDLSDGSTASNASADEVLEQLRRKLEVASEEVFWLHQLAARLKRVSAPDSDQLAAFKGVGRRKAGA